jgi:hypothetical protein
MIKEHVEGRFPEIVTTTTAACDSCEVSCEASRQYGNGHWEHGAATARAISEDLRSGYADRYRN